MTEKLDYLFSDDFAIREAVLEELVQNATMATHAESFIIFEQVFSRLEYATSESLSTALSFISICILPAGGNSTEGEESTTSGEFAYPCIQAARESVGLHSPQIIDWTTHSSARVREQAVTVLARSGDSTYLDLLLTRMAEETDTRVQAALIRELRHIDSSHAIQIATAQLGSSDINIRAQAARTLCQLTSPSPPTLALRSLMSLPIEFWDDRWVRIATVPILRDLGPSVWNQAIRTWIERLGNPPCSQESYTNFLVRTAFPVSTAFPPQLAPGDLNETQFLLLRVIANTPTLWEKRPPLPRPNIYDDLLDSGLPATKSELLDFLASCPMSGEEQV